MSIIQIVAGGPIDHIPTLSAVEDTDHTWIGVDRGVIYLLKFGITPHFAIGDFDSVTESEWEEITAHIPTVNRFRPEKDETDMELAIEWALKQNPAAIHIYGATGGRLDHFMASAFMLTRYKQSHPHVEIQMYDRQNSLSVYFPGTYGVCSDEIKKYISFIPLSPSVAGLTLAGFKYPLTAHDVSFGSSLCVSNELIQQTGTFSFEKGILMMIRSTD